MTEEATHVRCSCGLIVAKDKMNRHRESEHFIKIISDYHEGKKE